MAIVGTVCVVCTGLLPHVCTGDTAANYLMSTVKEEDARIAQAGLMAFKDVVKANPVGSCTRQNLCRAGQSKWFMTDNQQHVQQDEENN